MVWESTGFIHPPLLIVIALSCCHHWACRILYREGRGYLSRGGERKGIKFLIQNNYLYQPDVYIERNTITMMSQPTYVTVRPSVYLLFP